MSDPTDGAKATTANAPSRTTGSQAPAPAQGGPASKGIDLTEWKAPPTAQEQAAAAAPPRPRDPKVEWGQLAGIRGLAIVRISGVRTTEKKGQTYEWIGSTVRMPPTKNHPKGQDVFCLTGTGTVAGGALVEALRKGVFDACSDAHPVAVAVRAQFSPDYPDGRPIALLTFG